MSRIIVLCSLLLVWAAPGCTPEGGKIGPPEGWIAEGDRWWVAGDDTAALFRPLELLEEMALESTGAASDDAAIRQARVDLLPLYRNEPQVVDSLFERHVRPLVEAEGMSPDRAGRKAAQRRAYELITNNFQPPTQAGEVPVSYPDSLRRRGAAGTVRMQVALDAEGRPRAIERLSGVHPTLDALALEAVTRMRWRPAYLLRGGKWRPVPSWTRFSLTFGVAPGQNPVAPAV